MNKANDAINKFCFPIFRKEEIDYCSQIYHQYISNNTNPKLIKRMFQTLHSDWLNIQSHKLTQNTTDFKVLRSNASYQKGDVVLQIRGSIIKKEKLSKLIEEKKQVKEAISKVQCLIWGENETEVLIPKGISRVLMNGCSQYRSFVKGQQKQKNCLIQNEMGMKYLVSASRQIKEGEILILDLDSLQRFQYSK